MKKNESHEANYEQIIREIKDKFFDTNVTQEMLATRRKDYHLLKEIFEIYQEKFNTPPRIDNKHNIMMFYDDKRTIINENKNYSNTDSHLYTDDEINLLFKQIQKNNANVHILDAMLGTDWLGEEGKENTLSNNLLAFNQQRSLTISKNQQVINNLLIPVNLGNYHWVLLYISYPISLAHNLSIFYFDPLGNPMPSDVLQAVREAFSLFQLSVNPIGQRVQNDSYNCGPWIVLAAKMLITTDRVPEAGDMNIQQKRKEQQLLLQRLLSDASKENILQTSGDGLEIYHQLSQASQLYGVFKDKYRNPLTRDCEETIGSLQAAKDSYKIILRRELSEINRGIVEKRLAKLKAPETSFSPNLFAGQRFVHGQNQPSNNNNHQPDPDFRLEKKFE